MSNNFKFHVFVAGFLLAVFSATLLIHTLVNTPPWHYVVDSMNGEFVDNDQSGHSCAWYAQDQQLICYQTFQTWIGEDAIPLYVIDHGKYIPLFKEKQHVASAD